MYGNWDEIFLLTSLSDSAKGTPGKGHTLNVARNLEIKIDTLCPPRSTAKLSAASYAGIAKDCPWEKNLQEAKHDPLHKLAE